MGKAIFNRVHSAIKNRRSDPKDKTKNKYHEKTYFTYSYYTNSYFRK